MSRIRANKITNKVGTGAIELEKGAHLPIGMGITGAGGLNITGVVTAGSFAGDGSGLIGVASTDNIVTGTAATFNTFPVDINAGMTVAGVSTMAAITATTGTFSGSVSIGGTLTYEDVTNIDSVGIVTAREGIFLPDTKELKIGNTAASPDFTIFHSSGANYIKAINNQSLNFATNNTNRAMFESGGHFRPIVDSTYDLGITGTRWRNVYADTYYGDGSNLTGISVGIATNAQTVTNGNTLLLDLSKDDHKVTATGTVTISCTGGTEGDSHTVRIVNSGIATVGFSTYFLFPSGGTPSIPTTSGTISLITFTVHQAGSTGISTQLLSGASVNFN